MITIAFILFSILIIPGITSCVTSGLSGRRGTNFFQPLRDVRVLLKKAPLRSSSSSLISSIAPPLILASSIVAMLIMPVGSNYNSVLHFDGDIIVFCLLLSFSRIMIVLLALDCGGGFPGLGAARASFFSLLIEPTLFLLLCSLPIITGYDSFSEVFASFDSTSLPLIAISMVVGYGLFNYTLVECGLSPYEDPHTHLELTMTHEAMLLDVSGVDLALIKISEWIKLSLFATLIVNIYIPVDVSGWELLLIAGGGIVVLAAVLGVVEFFTARTRMNKNATYITTIAAIAILANIVALLVKFEILR